MEDTTPLLVASLAVGKPTEVKRHETLMSTRNICSCQLKELAVSTPSGTHSAPSEKEDIVTLVTVFQNAELFKHHPQRRYSAFPGFSKNLLGKLNYSDLYRWMRAKLKDWRELPI